MTPDEVAALLPCPYCGRDARELDAEVCNFLSSIESKERWFDGGVDLNAHQLRQALDFLGGDEESEVTIKRLTTAQAEEGGGVYVWCSEYPEEGSMKLVPREDKEPTAPDLTLSIGAVPSEVAAPPAPPVQSETPEEPEVVRRLKDLASDDQTLEENALLAHIRDLRSLLTQREEEITELRLEWFRKGQDSVRRRNESGCCCKIDDDGETILSPCAARQAWAELARMKK